MPKETKNLKNISEQIKSKIHANEIHMKPKHYFVAGTVSLFIGMLGSFLLSGFLINVITHRIRVNRLPEYLEMDGYGQRIFLSHFPWLPFILSIAFLIFGAYMLKRFDISYKKSFLVIFLGILITTIISGVLIDKSGVNLRLEHMRPLKPLYDSPLRNKTWVIGILDNVQEGYYVVKTETNENVLRVNISNDTWLPRKPLEKDECVKIVGIFGKENEFLAQGITRCAPKNRGLNKPRY